MVVYREKERPSIGKWILAALIFIIVMTVTFADVEGANSVSTTIAGSASLYSESGVEMPSDYSQIGPGYTSATIP
jgi:hypothetical protein